MKTNLRIIYQGQYLYNMEKVEVYECRGCGEFLLAPKAVSENDGGCCGEGLREMEEDNLKTDVNTPEAENVLRDMFGLGETSLNICFCVIDNEGATVSEVADEMDIDRSAVSRHMTTLVETGILTRQERNLRQGGVVHVYSHEDPELVKERVTLGAFFWASKAIELVNELNDEKMEAMMEEDVDVVEALGGKIWKEA